MQAREQSRKILGFIAAPRLIDAGFNGVAPAFDVHAGLEIMLSISCSTRPRPAWVWRPVRASPTGNIHCPAGAWRRRPTWLDRGGMGLFLSTAAGVFVEVGTGIIGSVPLPLDRDPACRQRRQGPVGGLTKKRGGAAGGMKPLQENQSIVRSGCHALSASKNTSRSSDFLKPRGNQLLPAHLRLVVTN